MAGRVVHRRRRCYCAVLLPVSPPARLRSVLSVVILTVNSFCDVVTLRHRHDQLRSGPTQLYCEDRKCQELYNLGYQVLVIGLSVRLV